MPRKPGGAAKAQVKVASGSGGRTVRRCRVGQKIKFHDLVKQNRITSEQAEDYITIRNWNDERFELLLEEWYPSGKIYRQPEYWDDSSFNRPSQPVVGVSWFEARAYCAWLRAQAGQNFRLPCEVEREAAARGKSGRDYAYEGEFDSAKGNSFESHLRRTVPVGIYPANLTPEGARDLAGNVYDWTSTIYDQARFLYPYRADDGRENVDDGDAYRVVRGGSWGNNRYDARAVYRGRGTTRMIATITSGFGWWWVASLLRVLDLWFSDLCSSVSEMSAQRIEFCAELGLYSEPQSDADRAGSPETWCGAVRGTTIRTTLAPSTATGTTRMNATITSGFGWW